MPEAMAMTDPNRVTYGCTSLTVIKLKEAEQILKRDVKAPMFE